MKMSFCQMIAIVCILTVGFIIIAPFVSEDAAADDYTKTLTIHITRVMCANGVVHHYVSREMRRIQPHTNNEPHQHDPPGLRVYFNNDETCSVSGCYNCS